MEETKEGPRGEKQGDDPDNEAQKHILRSFFRAVQRYGRKLRDIFSGVSDPRQAGKIAYPLYVLLFTGVLLFACQLGARRQINHKLRGNATVQKKYRALFGVEDIPHGDTLNYGYQRLKVGEVQEVICRLVEKLMVEEDLHKWRLFALY